MIRKVRKFIRQLFVMVILDSNSNTVVLEGDMRQLQEVSYFMIWVLNKSTLWNVRF